MKLNFALLLQLAVIVVAITSCSGNSGSDESTRTPVNVEVQRSSVADGSHAMAYSGTLEESETIPLTFPVVGTVDRVLVAEGDAVTKGQPLAFLNNQTYKNIYDMALASLRQAEDAYKRLDPMFKNGNLPEVKYIEIETDLQKAKSAAVIARKNLDDCTLTSPTDGIVGRRSIEPGMTAMPNGTSLTIVKMHKVFARVSVPENEISLMRKGLKARVNIAALHNAVFDGTIEEVGVLADPLAHTYKIKIGISNKDLAIRPGMICTVLIPQSGSIRGVTVAGSAILVDETGRNYVYVVDSSRGIATRRFVTPCALLNDGIALGQGLQTNELVVVSGQHKLVDSAAVRIINR
jgi:membrane fusion protein, multidrug efflux system